MKNAIVVKYDDIWKYPVGTEIRIGDKAYVYVSSCDDYGKMFYDVGKGVFVHEEELFSELDEETAVVVDIGEIDLGRLIDIKMKNLLLRINEGARDRGLTELFSITSELDELVELCKLARIRGEK
jgi:hypothetical protein